MNVRLSKEQKVKVANAGSIYDVMQQVLLRENKIRRNQEHFWVVGLDTQNKILFIELVSLGAVNKVQVHPPEVFRMAIYKMAVKVVLVHNHPSGNVKPSSADKDLTDRMLKTGELINIKVIDHLIISETEFTSFAQAGIMNELRNTGLYEVMDEERRQLEEWKQQEEKARAVKENKLDIAKKMVEKGYDADVIKELTGLTKWDIRKL